MGCGSYKEAWRVGSICIKFASDVNTIEKEIAVYNKAFEDNLNHIFAHTCFLKLPEDTRLLLTELDPETVYPGDSRFTAEDGSYCYAQPKAAYLILQPVVSLPDDLTRPLSPISYGETPLRINGEMIDFDEYNQIDAPLEWHEAIITKWGEDEYYRVIAALRDLKIYDLHEGNVGWFGDTPIILDWLSGAPI